MFATLFLVLGYLASYTHSVSDYYFVIAPNVLRYEHDETVSVNIFGGQRNVQIEVWLEHGDTQFSKSTVSVVDRGHPALTTVKVSESDIFGTVALGKPRSLQLCARRPQLAENKNCRNVLISYKSGYMIVQTDKPIYTPRQKVNIRVLAVDESLKVIKNQNRQIALDVVSPSDVTLARKVFSMTEGSGFFKNDFDLPPSPEIGMWTARAFYMGKYETVATAVFEVKEYVLPTFGVTIDVSEPYILENTARSITITVTATYVYGKMVQGNAELTLNITDPSGDSKYILDMPRQPLERGAVEFTLSTNAIFQSPSLRNKNFPDGSKLLVVARVTEGPTGKIESTFHESTVFASKPYVIKFHKSKKYFHPGMEYYLKASVERPNGEPAIGESFRVTMYIGGDEQAVRDTTTDNEGQGLAVFRTTGSSILTFKVMSSNFAFESEAFEVRPYEGKNQMVVETIITADERKEMQMRAFNNMQVEAQATRYTGMLFMIVARGNIVYANYSEATNQASNPIHEEIQEEISPSARLIVFYVDDTSRQLVADSIKFAVEKRCRGKNLDVQPDRTLLQPGQNDKLTVTGERHTWVGLNIMDKALLLLNKENILKKNKMFRALEEHDLGCGPGSGKDSADVFQNAGMMVVTNAQVRIQDEARQCEDSQRKKRDTECLYNADERCCEMGRLVAENIFIDTDKDDRPTIEPYAKCYVKTRNYTKNEEISTRCIQAFFDSCRTELEDLISKETHIVSKTLEDETEYSADLAELYKKNVKPYTRTDFRESIKFEELQLDVNGHAERIINYPDSITTWMILAIGITEDKGMCIADPKEVQVFREFFIQLDLPYKASRLEVLNVKATIFNYGVETDPVKQANIYLRGTEGLCYSGEPGKESAATNIEIGPNSAKTVSFPVVPIRDGALPVTVSAMVTKLGVPQVDVIEKPLYVVHEGVTEHIDIQVCLDPNDQMNDCENDQRVTITKKGGGLEIVDVDLMLPSGHIPGTGAATAYVYGSAIDGLVQTMLRGAENLFKMPYGCTEQTASSFAPNVFAMMYLQKTNQVTSAIEETGSRNIRAGVTREVTMYMKSDGSYYAYASNNESSVWLTAFVGKLICQSKEVVDDAVIESQHIHPTIRWLRGVPTGNGRVNENSKLQSFMRYVNTGNMDPNTPALTSFWLITMLECNVLQQEIQPSVNRSLQYVENLGDLTYDPYLLAMSTYALALAKSSKRWDLKSQMERIMRRSGESVFWGKDDSGNSYNIETTAYALLAMLQFDDLKTSGSIVRWLTARQDGRGAFTNTQDTYVALQALSQYSIRTFTKDVNLQVQLLAEGFTESIALTYKEYQLRSIVDKIPVETKTSMVTVEVKGTAGSGRMKIDLRYNRLAKDDEICPFELSKVNVGKVVDYSIETFISNERKCDVCGRCEKEAANADRVPTTLAPVNTVESNFGRRKRQTENGQKRCIRFSVSSKNNKNHGMSMVLFGLETGVSVEEDDLKKLVAENENLDMYELPTEGRNFVAFYLNSLTSEKNEFTFRLVDNFDGVKESRQPATVTVFDYYKPEYKCMELYSAGPNAEPVVNYQCQDQRNEQCKCLQSMCSKPVEDEIKQMTKDRDRLPAPALVRYTCNSDKADYAVRVKIVRVWEENQIKLAKGSVVTSIHRGAVAHSPGDLLIFYWRKSCPYPDLEPSSDYYIIAKDGHQVRIDDRTLEYRYDLMGTALVVKVQDRGLISIVMNNYQRLMRAGCQQ